jgi:hypothetical protein
VGAITESNESDNCTSWDTVTVGQADLTAGSITPTTAIENTATTLSATVTNLGSASTGSSFTNLFQIDADSNHTTVTATRTDTSPALNPSGTDVSQVSYIFAAVGTWYVRACADNDASWVSTIPESNEGNNCGAWTSVLVTDASGCALPPGHEDYCALAPTGCGPCSVGKGDCDSASECTVGLICPEVSGTDYCVLPQCSNGSDDDGDGLFDYPQDTGCTSGTDNDETTPFECSDNTDNDGNGKRDYPQDPGCTSAADNNESIPPAGISLTADPDYVQDEKNATLNWAVQDVQSGSCYITGPGYNSGPLVGSSGSVTTPAITSEVNFVIHCSNLDGVPVSSSVTIRTQGTIIEI